MGGFLGGWWDFTRMGTFFFTWIWKGIQYPHVYNLPGFGRSFLMLFTYLLFCAVISCEGEQIDLRRRNQEMECDGDDNRTGMERNGTDFTSGKTRYQRTAYGRILELWS